MLFVLKFIGEVLLEILLNYSLDIYCCIIVVFSYRL